MARADPIRPLKATNRDNSNEIWKGEDNNKNEYFKLIEDSDKQVNMP